MRDKKTYAIIGAAIEVHKELGCGFPEAVYQEALEREFRMQKIPFKSQPVVKILYKGNQLAKTYQPDFMCFDEVIIEISNYSA
jgi:GxxExxY protein